MNKPKNWVRVLVLVGLVAWPAYEYSRLRQAERDLAASELLWKSVEAKVAQAKVKYAAAPVTPPGSESNQQIR